MVQERAIVTMADQQMLCIVTDVGNHCSICGQQQANVENNIGLPDDV